MIRSTALVLAALLSFPALAELRAGVGKASITPLEEGIPTQLGGYGARVGAPALGIHDTIYAKVLLFDDNGKCAALIGMDSCTVPIGLVRDALEQAGVEGLTVENTMMAASHSHAGLEGFSMDQRNIAGNPHIGVFSEPVLQFVAARVAEAIQAAEADLQPVTVGAGTVQIDSMNRNRRGDECTDPDLTVLRVDRADGTPLAVHVNYTAHGTIMTENEMLISGGWAGVMQRTVEAILAKGVTCLYSNGAEGDISPANYQGGSRWESAEYYGKRIGIAAAELAADTETTQADGFAIACEWVKLPARQAAPDFLKIAGDEYNVTAEQLDMILPIMFPGEAPIYAFRIGGYQLATFPGEAICVLGKEAKQAMSDAGIEHPVAVALTNEQIGYILTPEEYAQSGYEVTASFYGDQLGPLLTEKVVALAKQVAE